MANRGWLNRIGGFLLPAPSVHHFLTITIGRYSFVIAFVAIFSIPSVVCTVFFLTCSEWVMTTPFFALLSGVVAPVSATSSATLTCTLPFWCPVQDRVFWLQLGFRSCGVPPGIDPSVVKSSHTPRSAFLRTSDILHCCQRSPSPLSPVPICSKIWEVCFDVNTVLDDPPITSWRCYPHAPRRCYLRQASDSAVWLLTFCVSVWSPMASHCNTLVSCVLQQC